MLFAYSKFCFILALMFVIGGSFLAIKKQKKSILLSSYLLAAICILTGVITIQI